MAIVSYLLGKKYYPVNYAIRRIIGYIGLGLGLYFAHRHLSLILDWQPWLLASALLLLYVLITALLEGRQITGKSAA